MSDDNVITGIFGRKEEKEEDVIISPASEMYEILAHACTDDTVGIALVYTPGEPLVLAANVDEDYVNVLLDMGKYEIMHRLLAAQELNGGPTDDTIH